MTNKITNRDALCAAIAAIKSDKETSDHYMVATKDGKSKRVTPDEVIAKLENMAASLDNKAASTTRKPTAKQVENIGLRKSIMDFLRGNPNLLVTCTDIGKKVKELDGMNNQRISALMRALVESGEVVKITEKGKSLFQLAKPTEGEGEEGE